MTVNEELFNQRNPQLLAQAVRVYLSNQRQGTSKTQTRSDVSRTTRKWYRQKGTGNARHGAKDATLFVGGAVAHGPTGKENWKKSLPAALKKKALIAALSAQADNIVLNDEINELKGKTKEAYQLLKEISEKFEDEAIEIDTTKFLIVPAERRTQTERAISNLPNVKLVTADKLNALIAAQADKIILTQEGLDELEARLIKE